MASFKFLVKISRLNKKIHYWNIRENLLVIYYRDRPQEPFIHYILNTHVINELKTSNEIEKSLFSKWVEGKEPIPKLSNANPILWLVNDKKNKSNSFAAVST